MSIKTEKRWIYGPTAGDHDYEVYEESTGKTIALVRDFNEDNARLISTAPELLAALKLILAAAQIHDRTTGFFKPLCPYETQKICRAATDLLFTSVRYDHDNKTKL